MKTTDVLNSCEKYFNGFHNVYEHKDVRSTVEGVLKIISYLTLIFPCAFAIAYYKYRDVKQINEIVDNFVWLKVDIAYHQLNENEKALKTRQNDLIEYLLIKAQDVEMNNPTEMQRFQKAFYLLDPKSQITFFKKCTSNQLFCKVIDLIPRDLSSLHFTTHNEASWLDGIFPDVFVERKNPIWEGGKNSKMLLEKLHEFTELKTLSLQLEEIGYFGPNATAYLQNMVKFPGSSGSGAERMKYDHSGGLMFCKDTDTFYIEITNAPVMNTIEFIAKFAANRPELNYSVDFHNIGIARYNAEYHIKFHGLDVPDAGPESYSTTLLKYFQMQ